MRTLLATGLGLLVLAVGSPAVPAQEAAPREVRAERERFDAAREAAALAFVRENHPELADLLEQLKAMKPDQYERAIAELWQVSRTLANFKKNDERRYRVALDVWKAKSRAELLAAQLVGVGTPGAELEGRLRDALKAQLAAEIRQQRLEREILKERLKKLDETIERLESRGDKQVELRYQTLLKKGQRARRQEAGQSAPSASAAGKGESQR